MRYALSLKNDLYLAACYEATGCSVRLTKIPEDACSYKNIDKALSVAAQLQHTLGFLPTVVEVEN